MCYMIAAGKKATADGSVMVARNCDTNATEAQQIISMPRRQHRPGELLKIPECPTAIPQVAETYAYTAVARRLPGETLELVAGGINEFQVSAGASSGGWVKPEVSRLTQPPATAIGDYMMTLVLQRCRTAREAIQLLGELTEQYGARTDNYIVADSEEAWLFEQYQGYHWAAARVPDDCFVVEANSFRLAEIDLDDPERYAGSPDLISFATAHGLWDPASGRPFRAARAYGTDDLNRERGGLPQPYYSLHRIWRGLMLLAPSAALDPYDPAREYPLFLAPDRKLTPADILAVLKDRYRGTQLDEYGAQDGQYPVPVDRETGRYRLAPAWSHSRMIGCPQTVTSWVTQSRGWLPNEVGGILWAGLGAAAASPHIPWYACNQDTPPEFQRGIPGADGEYMPDSAYWKFETAGNIMNLFYQGTADLVEPVWTEFDARSFRRQQAVEQTALGLLETCPAEAQQYLTDYSNQTAVASMQRADEMLRALFTRIALLNNPHTNRAYEPAGAWQMSRTAY